MTTATITGFEINGVIDTNIGVLQNMNNIASAAGSWVTFDVNQGKWAVIINQTGSRTSSFTDSNIIGSVNVSSTGLVELYNNVEIEFPNSDILDQKDYVKFEIPDGDRYPNELDNELQIQSDLINNAPQADLIASRELKQSRVDKVIEFRTDYTKMGLKAGDLIDITLSQYAWTSKVFRITRIEEEDTDDGQIVISITALEYDADVYSTSGLSRTTRSVGNEITAKKNNTAVTSADTGKTTNDLSDSLTDPANLALAVSLMGALAPNGSSGRSSIGLTPQVSAFQTGLLTFGTFINVNSSDSDFVSIAWQAGEAYNLGYSATLPYAGTYKLDYFVNFGATTSTLSGGVFILPNTMRKRIQIYFSKNGSFQAPSSGVTTIIRGEDCFADLTASAFFTGAAGDVINFWILIRHDLGTTSIIPYNGNLYPASNWPGNEPVCVGIVTANLFCQGT
jgi:hypothetical protein